MSVCVINVFVHTYTHTHTRNFFYGRRSEYSNKLIRERRQLKSGHLDVLKAQFFSLEAPWKHNVDD